MKKFIVSAISFLFAFMLFAPAVSTVSAGYDPGKVMEATDYGPFKGDNGKNTDEKIKSFFGAAMSIVTLIVVGVLIYSGVMFATAAGDDGKIGKAQKTATYAIVGLIVSFVAGLIVRFVLNNILEVDSANSGSNQPSVQEL